MTKSAKVSLLFVLIFLTGVLIFVTYVNIYLNKSHSSGTYSEETEEVDLNYSHKR